MPQLKKVEIQAIADAFQRPVAVVKNTSREMKMYRRFHNKEPDTVLKVSHPAIPASLVSLGRLESVIYRKHSDNVLYIHDLKHGILAADRKGKLYIIGDRARITKRGIVG